MSDVVRERIAKVADHLLGYGLSERDARDAASQALLLAFPELFDGEHLIAPLEPSERMLAAFGSCCDDNGHCLVKTGYRAMIEAAA